MLGQIATVLLCTDLQEDLGLAAYQAMLPKPRYLLGLVYIAAQCFVWIAASVLTQYLLEETAVESPFLMTYVGVALCTVLFPLKWLHEAWQQRQVAVDQAAGEHDNDDDDDASFNAAVSRAKDYQEMLEVVSSRSRQNATATKPWNHKKHALAALHIAPAMFLSDYAYNRGLQHTTVASSTVLVSTSCVFVLFLSVLLRLEGFAWGKFLGVTLTVLGTAMTAWQDAALDEDYSLEQSTDEMAAYSNNNPYQQEAPQFSTRDMVYGDMFSLAAAVGYAAYSVQARLLCPDQDELYSMTLLLAYVGLTVSVPLLPMAAFKVYEMLLSAEVRMTWQTLGLLLTKGLLDFVVTDYLLFRAVVLTNPTIANVGLGLTIPLAFVADSLVKGLAPTHWQVAGALTVMAGFVVVNWMSQSDQLPADCSTGGPDASNERQHPHQNPRAMADADITVLIITQDSSESSITVAT